MPDKVTVAIFWLYQDRVLGVLEDRAASEADSLGLLDCTAQHVSSWAEVVSAAGLSDALHGIEYDDILRGRILYDCRRGRHIAHSDLKALSKQARKQVLEWAGIANDRLLWRHDQYYTIDRHGRYDVLDDY